MRITWLEDDAKEWEGAMDSFRINDRLISTSISQAGVLFYKELIQRLLGLVLAPKVQVSSAVSNAHHPLKVMVLGIVQSGHMVDLSKKKQLEK